jgi:hypothetical protein
VKKKIDEINVDLNPFILRQGDVNLVRVDDMPAEGMYEITPKDGRVVLMHGEATGHAHAFYDGGVKIFARNKNAERPDYLQVVRITALLKHEEHTTARIPPGIYRIPSQVEHTDDMEPRVVAD